MKNSSERKRYKTNPNFDAYLLYSYIQMKRNASDKISRDKADKLIYEYLNNYIMYELYYSYRSTLEKCEFQELYQSLWVEVLADLPRFNPDLGRATTFFRYSIKHAVCIFVSFKKYNTTPYLANQLEKIKKIQQECEESGTPFTVELASKYLHCTIPTVLNYQVKLGMESSFSYEVISVTNKYFSYDSYDDGYDDVYMEGDYDYDRYDRDSDYADGVDDAMDELGED